VSFDCNLHANAITPIQMRCRSRAQLRVGVRESKKRYKARRVIRSQQDDPHANLHVLLPLTPLAPLFAVWKAAFI
jgi:hypothetical protein